MRDFNMLEKTCAFYVSDTHLSAMIIPYVNKQIENNSIIETFLEVDLENNVETILSKLILDEKSKNKIKEINWRKNKTEENKIDEITNKLIKNSNKEINILINGGYEYIEKTNKILINILNKNCNKINNKIRIINCYSVEIADKYLEEIINSHSTMLNTAGIKKIEEIFDKNNKISV